MRKGRKTVVIVKFGDFCAPEKQLLPADERQTDKRGEPYGHREQREAGKKLITDGLPLVKGRLPSLEWFRTGALATRRKRWRKGRLDPPLPPHPPPYTHTYPPTHTHTHSHPRGKKGIKFSFSCRKTPFSF